MTVEVLGWLENTENSSAEIARRTIFALLQRGSTVGSVVGGLIGATDCQISAGSGMQAIVAPGEAIVSGSSSATQSGYYVRVSAAATLTISPASESLPRVDGIYLVIKDSAYTGSENEALLYVAEGTPTASATLTNLLGKAAAPTSSLLLGFVLVPAKAKNIEGADVSNRAKTVALGVGPWTAPESYLSANIGEAAGYLTVGVRQESGGAVARLRGCYKVLSGKSVVNGDTLMTLPVAFRPSADVNVAAPVGFGAAQIVISTGGAVTWEGAEAKAGELIGLDGITFSLT